MVDDGRNATTARGDGTIRMIRYNVMWHRKAESKLAMLWLGSLARTLISKAANAIDELLVVDAPMRGGEIGVRSRLLHVYPLTVLFTVQEDERRVEVIDVWLDLSSG